MFLARSCVLNCWPRLVAESSRSFSSLEMLSKKLDDLLYAAAGGITTLSGFDSAARPLVAASGTGGVAVSPKGDPVAIASFTESILLNFAFAEAKSKSVEGISSFVW